MKIKQHIIPVILCGGGGTRLWPMSNTQTPKQFLAPFDDQTLFQKTLGRVKGPEFAPAIIVTSAAHADLASHQAQDISANIGRMILEPCARNTAPAIAMAALSVPRDHLMLILPSDAYIDDVPAFLAAIRKGAGLAADGWLVTFGITPTSPETGYGYIQRGEAIGDAGFDVERFLEKPDQAKAQAMLDAGGHDWNGGIFLFRAGTFLDALAAHAPDIATASRAAFAATAQDTPIFAPQQADFAAIRSESIDYAVMEKADRVAVVPVAMGWSDVGSWDAIHSLSAQDSAGNVLGESGLAIDATGNLLISDGPRISVLGVSDLVVVVHQGEVIVLPRSRAQDVRKLAAARQT